MDYTYKDETSYYTFTIHGLKTHKDSETTELVAITRRRIRMWRREATVSYYANQCKALWVFLNENGKLTGDAKTKIEIKDGTVTVVPAAAYVYDWAEKYNREAGRKGEKPSEYCRTESQLCEWMKRVSGEEPVMDVSEAFDAFENSREIEFNIWNAANYISSRTGNDPAPEGWVTGYVVELEDGVGDLYNIFPAGGNFENGKWMQVDKDGETILAARLDRETEALLDAAVFAAETDSEKYHLNWELVYVYDVNTDNQ